MNQGVTVFSSVAVGPTGSRSNFQVVLRAIRKSLAFGAQVKISSRAYQTPEGAWKKLSGSRILLVAVRTGGEAEVVEEEEVVD